MNSAMMNELITSRRTPPASVGQQAFGEGLIAAGFPTEDGDSRSYGLYGVRQKFSTLPAHPELIIRPADLPEGQADAVDPGLMADLTGELLLLDNEYGLRTPGLSMAHEPRSDGQGMLEFIVANRVEGLSFKDHLSRIPEEVAVKGCRAIMGYYNDSATRGDGLFLWDLKAEQLIYGKLHDNEPEEIYFADFDPNTVTVSQDQGNKGYPVLKAAALHNINSSIAMLEKAYGKRFDELRAEQKLVAERFDGVSLAGQVCSGHEFALAA